MQPVDKAAILADLPEYRDEWVKVVDHQTVEDIIPEVLEAHRQFRGHYDRIAYHFDDADIERVCGALYQFLKKNVRYWEEGVRSQTTAIPAGLLIRGHGDCKQYAGFVAGVLDALGRQGRKIDWCYRFASYKPLVRTPHHVFVVVRDGDDEIWIDPTPTSEQKTPLWKIDKRVSDKKISGMALYRNIAGVDEQAQDMNLLFSDPEVDTTEDIGDDQAAAIALLLSRMVIDSNGRLNESRLRELSGDPEVANAYELLSATLSGFFDDLWRGTKVVTLAIPRNAFLGLVALNVFGMASKMKRVIGDAAGKKKLVDKWYSLGGKESGIISAIESGAKKNAILGNVHTIGAAQAAVPAWLAVAGGIIAAVMPLVNNLLKEKNQYSDFAYLDQQIPQEYSGGGVMDFVRNNPLVVAAGAGLLIWALWD